MIPEALARQLAGRQGWLLIHVREPQSPLARALLAGDPTLPPPEGILLVRPVLPEERGTSAVEAGFPFRAGLARPQRQKGKAAMTVRESWPCEIVPESSLEADDAARLPFESFTYVGPAGPTARYEPLLTAVRVVLTPVTVVLDVPLEVLRALGRAYAR
jgi:hypothetical protein